MPKPVYIITAKIISEDKDTRLISVFHIIERGEIRRRARHNAPQAESHAPKDVIPLQHGISKTIAVWMREDGDDGRFQHEFAIEFNGREISTGVSEFEFEPGMIFHRAFLNLHGFPVPERSGMLRIISRVRRVEDEQWLRSQEFPIHLIVMDADEQPADQPTPAD